MLIVRPWKLPSATTMVAWPSGTPLTRWPQRRASLSAVSTASAPEFIGSTMSLPASSASSAQNGPSWSWWNARDVSVSRPSCSHGRRHDLRVAVAEVERGIARQAVEVAASLDVGHPGSLAFGEDDRQRVIVVRAMLKLEFERVGHVVVMAAPSRQAAADRIAPGDCLTIVRPQALLGKPKTPNSSTVQLPSQVAHEAGAYGCDPIGRNGRRQGLDRESDTDRTAGPEESIQLL